MHALVTPVVRTRKQQMTPTTITVTRVLRGPGWRAHLAEAETELHTALDAQTCTADTSPGSPDGYEQPQLTITDHGTWATITLTTHSDRGDDVVTPKRDTRPHTPTSKGPRGR